MSATKQQAVLVFLKLSDDEFGSFEEREAILDLEERIEATFQADEAAEYDGHEFGAGWARLFLYGRDCRQLTERVLPLLRDFAPRAGSHLIQRQGPPGSPEATLNL